MQYLRSGQSAPARTSPGPASTGLWGWASFPTFSTTRMADVEEDDAAIAHAELVLDRLSAGHSPSATRPITGP